MPLSLRTAAPADAAAVRDLTRRAYEAWIPIIGREPRPMGADYDRAVLDHRIDLCFEGPRLAALIETEAREDHLFIVNIAVDPLLHGRGLGRRLLAHAERLAADAGFTELRLTTNQLMARNVRIYQAFGYTLTRLEPIPDGVVAHMSKPLG
jgi:GNAT superfamily N-acetyltransferase